MVCGVCGVVYVVWYAAAVLHDEVIYLCLRRVVLLAINGE